MSLVSANNQPELEATLKEILISKKHQASLEDLARMRGAI